MYVHYMCKDNNDTMYLHIADIECSTGCIFQSHTAEELHSIAVGNISLGNLSCRSKTMPYSILDFGLHLFE